MNPSKLISNKKHTVHMYYAGWNTWHTIDHNQPRDQVVSSQILQFGKLPHHYIHRGCDRSCRWEIFHLCNSLIIQHFWNARLLWCIRFLFFFYDIPHPPPKKKSVLQVSEQRLTHYPLDSMTAHIPCMVYCTSTRADSFKADLSGLEFFIFVYSFLPFVQEDGQWLCVCSA